MVKSLKVLVLFITAFTLMIGIDAKALENIVTIGIPIQKTDKQGNPLEGATFTLKDINNTKSFDSIDKRDGYYLINGFNPLTQEEVLAMLPEKYQAVINDIASTNNYENIQNYTQDFYVRDFYIDILFPMYIEETVPPTGYKSKKIVVPAFATFYFSHDGNQVQLSVLSSEEIFEVGYFEYEENKDYIEIFDKANYYWSTDNYNPNLYRTHFGNNGMLKDKVVCDIDIPAVSSEEITSGFTPEEIDGLCILQIENEKEEVKEEKVKKEIIVNPTTTSSIIIFIAFVVISIGLLTIRKTSNN